MNVIVSSWEEFGLLLKKWTNERRNVAVFFTLGDSHAVNRARILLFGTILSFDESIAEIVISDEQKGLAVLHYAGCVLQFAAADTDADLAKISEGIRMISTGRVFA